MTVDAVVQHDVVTALGVVVVVSAAAEQDVGATLRVVLERQGLVALHQVVTARTLEPVVVLVAGEDVVGVATADEVAARTTVRGRDLVAVEDEVAAGVPEDQVDPRAAVDGVVTRPAVDDVRTEEVGDGVVPGAAVDRVVAHAALEAVVAAVAPDRVVTLAAADALRSVGAVDDDVLVAVPPPLAAHLDQAGRPRLGQVAQVDDEVRAGEQVRGQVARVRVALDQLGERVVLELGQQVQALRPGQVVEPVGVLEVLHLRLEDEVERRAEQTAEEQPVLSQATHPEVDVVQAGLGRRGVHEHRVGDEGLGGLPLLGDRGGPLERRVDAVRGDEVHDRRAVPQGQAEVLPADVRLERSVVRRLPEGASRLLQGRGPGVAGTGDVDRREVQREAEQAVPQGRDDELVDPVAGLAGHALDDRGRTLVRVEPAVVGELGRVQERVEQWQVLRAEALAGDGRREHGVPEPVDDVRELSRDRRVDVRVVGGLVDRLVVDRGLHEATELLEREVLVLHLRDEAGSLEETLPEVPRAGLVVPLRDEGGVAAALEDVLDVADEAVVLGVEDVVHGGETDVLVATAVTGDVVRVEQVGVVARVGGDGVVRDVVEERVAGVERGGGVHRVRRVTLDEDQVVGCGAQGRVDRHHELRVAVRTGDEAPVGVGRQQRDGLHVEVVQLDAQQLTALLLDVCPGRQAVALAVVVDVDAVEQLAGRDGAVGRRLVLAQECLVRRVGGVGLVLVHEWRGAVLVLHDAAGVDVLRRPRDHDEVRGRGGVVQRVVGLERDDDGAVAALGDQVQTVVEELSEEREPRVERRREALVRGDVRDVDLARGEGLAHDGADVDGVDLDPRTAGRRSLGAGGRHPQLVQGGRQAVRLEHDLLVAPRGRVQVDEHGRGAVELDLGDAVARADRRDDADRVALEPHGNGVVGGVRVLVGAVGAGPVVRALRVDPRAFEGQLRGGLLDTGVLERAVAVGGRGLDRRPFDALRGGDGGRVRGRLVRDEVGDDARVGVVDEAGALRVGGRGARGAAGGAERDRVRAPEDRGDQPREQLQARTEGVLLGVEVVERAVDRAQAPGELLVGDAGAGGVGLRRAQQSGARDVRLGDRDLGEDELEVLDRDVELGVGVGDTGGGHGADGTGHRDRRGYGDRADPEAASWPARGCCCGREHVGTSVDPGVGIGSRAAGAPRRT